VDRPALLLQPGADPGLAAAAADKGGPGGAGVTKYIARARCCGFAGRPWSPGCRESGTSARANNLGNAITLGHLGQDYYGLVIGIGAWLGSIMAFNVWVFIWPNQKKILGIVPATDEEKGKARKVAATGIAHQLRAVDSAAAVHGRIQSPAAVLSELPADLPEQVVARAARGHRLGRRHRRTDSRHGADARGYCAASGGAVRGAVVR
jgi:hypothetical protein